MTSAATTSFLALSNAATPEHRLPDALLAGILATTPASTASHVLSVTTSEQRVSVIEAGVGAGKSFALKAIREAYSAAGYEVVGVCLSWRGAQVLEACVGKDFPTTAIDPLSARLSQARAKGEAVWTQPTLLLIDGAEAIDQDVVARLLEEATATGVPVKAVLAGDLAQVRNPAYNSLKVLMESRQEAPAPSRPKM